MTEALKVEATESHHGNIGGIPVRNIWLLFLYASDLAQFHGKFTAEVEQSPEFHDLIARLLCYAVQKRIRRNLSRGYIQTSAVLPRVRGRIDHLKTQSHFLIQQGKVACRFEDYTINTPRNRLVRAALEALTPRVSDADLAFRCRQLASDLRSMGVDGLKPSRADINTDQISRNETDDLLMVELSKTVFDLVLPTENAGGRSVTQIDKNVRLVRQLFEKAISNFYASELPRSEGWEVHPGIWLNWPIQNMSQGMADIFPKMKTDIVILNIQQNRRIVIDTKFTNVFGRSQYRGNILKSGYIYQMYAYLRSQEEQTRLGVKDAEGLFIHPTVNEEVDETVTMQGHKIRFATVDLMQDTAHILDRLRSIIL